MKISEAVSTALSATNHAIQHGIDLFMAYIPQVMSEIFASSSEHATSAFFLH